MASSRTRESASGRASNRPTRLELSSHRPVRRSHAERTAQTRAKIIAAVVDSITEVGYQGTTAVEVTRRAGVTWGAVQHHFGGKDGMLTAVLEESFNRFAALIMQIPMEDTSLAERSTMFVERAWEHFSSRHHRATFEILMFYMRREHTDADEAESWQRRMTRAWDDVWTRLFADARIGRRRSLILQRYTIAALSGLASTVALGGKGAALAGVELELLADTLSRELTGPAPSR